MVWTSPQYQGQGLAKKLMLKLVENSINEITLEVHQDNPAKFLYKNLKFIEESKKSQNLCMRYRRRISVMQPYIFPYIGYFHLIESTDKIVFYDDVNYIKRGWINRNRILLNNSDFLFTIPVEKVSQNKLINEIVPIIDSAFSKKFFSQIEQAYKRAPFYKEVLEILKVVLLSKHTNIADLSICSIISVYEYLEKEINWVKSSIQFSQNKGMEKADRLIKISGDLGFDCYVNSIGGRELYSKEYFIKKGIKLHFVNSRKIEYKQFDSTFVPNLSIIDVLMFNDKNSVRKLLTEYDFV
jgi:hypothetical protein